jgi:hypothetical protein
MHDGSREEDPAPVDVADLLSRAEIHGLAGLVYASLATEEEGLDASIRRAYGVREAARVLDHRAHLDLLQRIDACLHGAGLAAVALKGPLLAERLYEVPAARATSDVDLLVAEADLGRAVSVLASVGYSASTHPSERRFREEHHHLHLWSRQALPLELHFHAYVGFGRVLRSEPLIERKVAIRRLRAIGVLAPEDELVYLAVHGAAHRFTRLAWLYDLYLLVGTMSEEALRVAALRARSWGYGRVLAFAAELLARVFDVPDRVASLGSLGRFRGRIVHRVAAEPESAVLRSATRFIYSMALCDELDDAARYVAKASSDRLGRVAGRRDS